MSMQNSETGSCFDDGRILDTLDGDCKQAETEVMERHLLSCLKCQKLLASHIRLARPEIEPEEQAQLDRIGLEQLAEQGKALYRAQAAGRRTVSGSRPPGFYITWRMAAAFLAVTVVTALVWSLFIQQSNLEKGMAALHQAYSRQRPLEPRLTGGFPYAPYEVRRGDEQGAVGADSLRLAEGLLAQAASEDESPRVYHLRGQFYLMQGDYGRALEVLEKALVEDPDNAQLLSDLGTVYLQTGERDRSMGDYSQAIEYFTRALELEPDVLEALFNRALSYQRMNALSEAKADWEQYLRMDATSSWAEEARRNLDRIRQRLNHASEMRREVQQEFLDAYAAADEAAARQLIEHYPSHIEPLFDRALEDYLDLSTAGKASEANEKWALADTLAGWFGESKRDRYYRSLLDQLKRATRQQEKTILQARQHFHRARASYKRAEFHNALKLYGQARALFLAAEQTSSVSLTDYWIGDTLFQLAQFQPSAETLMPLAETCRVNQYLKLRAMAMAKAAMAYLNLDQPSLDEELTRQALELFEALNESSWTLRSLLSLAWSVLEFGDYEQSLTLYLRASKLFYQYGGEPATISQFYTLAAEALDQMTRTSGAVACQEEAVRFAIESRQAQLIASTQADLGLLYGKLGRPADGMAKAEAAMESANRIRDEFIRNGTGAYTLLVQGQLRAQQGQWAKAREILNQAQRVFAGQGNRYFVTQARQRKVEPLLKLGQFQAAEAELRSSLDYAEHFRQNIALEEQRNGFHDRGSRLYETMTWLQFVIKRDPVAAFNAAETSRARSLLDLLHTAGKLEMDPDHVDLILDGAWKPLRLTDIQSALPTEIQLVQYAVTEDRVIIWVVSRDHFSAAQSEITEDQLAQLVENLRRAIERRSRLDIVNGYAGQLYEKLIRPVEPYLDPHKRVCFIPDKSLYYVPFAALRDVHLDAYLIERFALLSSPSASVFVQCQRKAQAKHGPWPVTMLSVGNPRINRSAFPRLADLPAAEVEAERSAQCYQSPSNRKPRLLIAEMATEPAVVGAMRSARVVNLAVHSLVDEYTPMLSKLVLAPSLNRGPINNRMAPADGEDGVLHAYEIYQLSFPRTQLVVLSACESGLGRYYRGEGIVGIARPFLARGVPSVVASLWAVESHATAQLIQRFHQHLQQQGTSISQALRAAQLEFLTSSAGGDDHPYFWSSFMVMGTDAAMRSQETEPWDQRQGFPAHS